MQQGGGAANERVAQQALFDLGKRYCLPGNLHDVIGTAERLENAAGPEAANVVGAVGPPVACLDEGARGEARLAQIALRTAEARHVDFASLAQRHLVARAIKQMHLRVEEWLAARNGAAVAGIDPMHADRAAHFGSAMHVPVFKLPGVMTRVIRIGPLAGCHDQAQAIGNRAFEESQERRREQRDRHLVVRHQRNQTRRIVKQGARRRNIGSASRHRQAKLSETKDETGR